MDFFRIVMMVFGVIGSVALLLSVCFPEKHFMDLVSACSYLITFLSPIVDFFSNKQKGNGAEEHESKLANKGIIFLCVASFILSFIGFANFFNERDDGPPTTTVPQSESSSQLNTTTTATTTTATTTATTTSTTIQTPNYSSKSYVQLQGNTIIGTICSEEIVLMQEYLAPKSGRYRFDFQISSVKNSYRVIISNSKDEEVASGYSSDGGVTADDLNANETYQIYVKPEQYDSSFTFEIKIHMPDN